MLKLKKHYLYNSLIIVLLVLIISLPKISMDAAKKGLLLWFNVIIPTLFPFILISNMIVHSNLIYFFNRLLNSLMSKLFLLPGTAGYGLLAGLLCGYPVGAKITTDLYNQKNITLKQAQYMMTFCNNASPMFVIGFIATGLIKTPSLGLMILIAIYSSNLLTAWIYQVLYASHLNTFKESYTILQKKRDTISFKLLDSSLMDTITLIVKIGGYIIFFSIILSCLSLVPLQTTLVHTFLLSTVELANGVELLSSSTYTMATKFVMLSTLTAFGGFSIYAQTASILSTTNISCKSYFISKIINGIITFFIALLFSFFM